MPFPSPQDLPDPRIEPRSLTLQADAIPSEPPGKCILKKLGIKPPYDLATPLLGIYPEETITEEYTCPSMFIATLFTIARTWNHSRCPLTDEWIKKLYIYTMEYCSAIKRNAFESVLMR